jgi:hypothetical protein
MDGNVIRLDQENIAGSDSAAAAKDRHHLQPGTGVDRRVAPQRPPGSSNQLN